MHERIRVMVKREENSGVNVLKILSVFIDQGFLELSDCLAYIDRYNKVGSIELDMSIEKKEKVTGLFQGLGIKFSVIPKS